MDEESTDVYANDKVRMESNHSPYLDTYNGVSNPGYETAPRDGKLADTTML